MKRRGTQAKSGRALAHLAGMLLAFDSCYLSFPAGRIHCKLSEFSCIADGVKQNKLRAKNL